MAEYNEDAQHPATAIRLQQAAREGDAPKSYELVAALQVTTGVAVLYFLLNGIGAAISTFTTSVWQSNGVASEAVLANLTNRTNDLALSLTSTLLPMLAAILICAILSHVIQGGTAFGFKKPVWQPRHINPATGIKRLFSVDNLLRGVLGVPKVAVIVLVTFAVIWHQRVDLVELQQIGARDVGQGLIDQLFIVLMAASGTLLAVSLFDYLVQWYSFQTKMRMTDQQLRDENKLQAIDPQIKSRRIEFFEQISNH